MLPLIAIRPQAFFMIPDWRWPLARIPVALVWLYEGLWSKVLNGHPEQLQIAQSFPGLSHSGAAAAVWLVGSVECLLALWVLWGVRPRQAALAQTVLLAAMNAAGLLWAAAEIPHPGQMLVMNLAFLTLAWLVAGHGSEDGKREAVAYGSAGSSVSRPALPLPSDPPKARSRAHLEPASPWLPGRVDGRSGPPQLIFGRMFEDPAIERAVFPAGCRVFSIASAGCTALSLAAQGFEVTAVDVNPAQVEYVRRRLQGHSLQRGRNDRLMACWRGWMRLCGLSRARLLQFLMMTDAAQQSQAWRCWKPFCLWRSSLRLMMHPQSLRLFFSRAFVSSLPKGFAEAIGRRLERGWSVHPNRRNPFAWELLLGRQPPAQASSQPNKEPGLASLACADAVEYLEACSPGAFGGFHLSNILDGASDSYRRRLMQAVRRAAAPGARLVLRSLAEPIDPLDERWAGLDRSLLWGAVRVEALACACRDSDLEECRTRLLAELEAAKGDSPWIGSSVIPSRSRRNSVTAWS